MALRGTDPGSYIIENTLVYAYRTFEVVLSSLGGGGVTPHVGHSGQEGSVNFPHLVVDRQSPGLDGHFDGHDYF